MASSSTAPRRETTPSNYQFGASLEIRSCLHNLGMCYVRGDGTPIDKERGREYLLKAAAKGFAPSYHELGMINLTEQSFEEAAKYFEKAITLEQQAQRRSNSEWELGKLYEQGQGVPLDIQRALKLIEASTAQECELEPHIQELRDLKLQQLREKEIGEQSVVIDLISPNGKCLFVKARKRMRFRQVLSAFARATGIPMNDLSAIHRSTKRRINPEFTLGEIDVSDGEIFEVDIHVSQVGG